MSLIICDQLEITFIVVHCDHYYSRRYCRRRSFWVEFCGPFNTDLDGEILSATHY